MENAGKSAWSQDTIYFDATVRRSGNSLVITIPPELARRFLIPEGQKVRLLGAVKQGLYVEGLISVYLGRFEVKEMASGVRFRLQPMNKVSEALDKVPDFLLQFAKKYSITKISHGPVKGGGIKAELLFGSLMEGNVIPRNGRVTRIVISELPQVAEEAGYKVLDLKSFEEEMPWENIEPAVISRFYHALQGRVKHEWRI